MEPLKTQVKDSDLIDQIRKAAYIHFGKDDILALEELIRRYRHAIPRPTPEQRDSEGLDNRGQ